MAISETKMQIVIANYFKDECDVNTSIRQAFEKGFRIGVKKGASIDRPQGEWIIEIDANGNTYGRCSVCGMKQYAGQLNFCPDCGARMKGAGNETEMP